MNRWVTIEAAELAVKALEEENARLKAEVGRLQSVHILDSIGIEQLKAEVERLTSDIQMEKENEDRLVREWQRANNEVYGLQTQVAALIDDQTRLKAENEKLKLTLEEERQISRQNWNYDPHYAYLQLNNAELKAKIESLKGEYSIDNNRLIKAGDLLYEWMVGAGRRTWSRPIDAITMDKSMETWEAAKKGVQS